MFHYRWSYPDDQESAAKRISDMIFEGAQKPEGIEEQVRTRMIARLYHVGSSPETAPLIEGSFTRVIAILDRMLASRDCLLGGKPSLADFGLAGQLAQLLSDPTPGAMLKAHAPNVVRWIGRMENPDPSGDFLPLAKVRDDIAELLSAELAIGYLPWMEANARAVADDAAGVSVEIGGQAFTQKPQRYAAKAFNELKRKRGLVEDETLAALLGETGVDAFLLSAVDEADEAAGDDDAGDEGAED
jgi:hypothetical protein